MKAAPPFYIGEDDPPAKREILRAALKLFSEQGLATTSIRDIADESGYTNPALYKHFESKEALAQHLFDVCHRRVWGRLNAAVAVSLFMGVVAMAVLLVLRFLGPADAVGRVVRP